MPENAVEAVLYVELRLLQTRMLGFLLVSDFSFMKLGNKYAKRKGRKNVALWYYSKKTYFKIIKAIDYKVK